MDSCEGNFLKFCSTNKEKSFKLSILIERFDLFNLVGRLAIRHQNLDALEKIIKLLTTKDEDFISHSYYPIYDVFFDEMQYLDKDSNERLMHLFMNQFTKRKGSNMLTVNEYNAFVLPAIKYVFKIFYLKYILENIQNGKWKKVIKIIILSVRFVALP